MEKVIGLRTASAGLFLIAVACMLQACAPTPTGELERHSIEALKASCNSACRGEQPQAVALPAGSRAYTTDEAVCLRYSDRLLCGTCPCVIPDSSYSGPSSCRFVVSAGVSLVCA